jgi:hypothetical protein
MALDMEAVKNVPVYLSFKTFQSAVDNLRAHGLPDPIDRTTWDSRSGADQTQIISAFKFLGLIGDGDHPTESLKKLKDTAANSEQEKRLLAEITRERYAKVFELDLKTATPAQLDTAIGSYGATGTTRERAVRFFLKLAEHCGISMSSRLTRGSSSVQPTVVTNGSPVPQKRRRARKTSNTIQQNDTGTPSTDAGNAMKTIQLPGVGGSLTISGTFNPFGLIGPERELVYKIIDLMNEFDAPAK